MAAEKPSCEASKADGGGGLFLPFGTTEHTWDPATRSILYLIGLLWCFLGVAIVADIFMSAIETITSKKKRVLNPETGRKVTVLVWNGTVANLTLMALGSSAPEILLSVIELMAGEFYSGALGPSTIVGSAAFNLLFISAVCVASIPPGEKRLIKDLPVFAVTASFSVFAYVWLVIILQFVSPDVVEPWEGVLSFLYFPLLVILAYLADKGYFSAKATRKEAKAKHVVSAEMSKEELAELMMQIRKDAPENADLSDEKVMKIIETRCAQPRSRAAYRVAATRSATGGKHVEIQPSHAPDAETGAVTVPQGTGDEKQMAMEKEKVIYIEFAAAKYAVVESCGKMDISIVRDGDLSKTVSVKYKSRDGTAHDGQDYTGVEGELVFGPDESRKDITVSILEDKSFEDDEWFFVDLLEAKSKDLSVVKIGEMKTTEILIVDDDDPGIIAFQDDEIKVTETPDDQKMHLTVNRKNGTNGRVTCQYTTENDTAVAGLDFEECSGELVFENGQMTAQIHLTIKAKGRYEGSEMFRMILSDPTDGARFDEHTDGGADTNILTIIVEAPEDAKNQVDKVSKLLQLNWDKAKIGSDNWASQFQAALYVGGDPESQKEAGVTEKVLHVCSMFWKFVFAFIPPTEYAGGWACFGTALAMIGLVTAIIGDLASLLGCSMGLPDSITAITFVALGTSLPDTFASKAAAQQDPYADASIGNITGSNSVNVFLGLGLPWMIGAFYWGAGVDKEWTEKHRVMMTTDEQTTILDRYPDGGFIVKAGALSFSVIVFTMCALACLFWLVARRKIWGGELGGPKGPKYATSGFFVMLWFTYVGISSWDTIRRQNEAESKLLL
jgi:solute carrier family 8 (sodium/calcium exchanger)